jgi:peptide deformylase
MILPIYAFGQPILRQKGVEIDKNYAGLEELIANMWATMYHSKGVGLAAQQVGLDIKLFVVDTLQIDKEDKEDETEMGIKQTFINATILEESGKVWGYSEGCLSIPEIRGEVQRKSNIVIEYLDENFEKKTQSFSGFNARVIQHEYDHNRGILFTDLLSPLKKTLIQKKLKDIRDGKIRAGYKMKFVSK